MIAFNCVQLLTNYLKNIHMFAILTQFLCVIVDEQSTKFLLINELYEVNNTLLYTLHILYLCGQLEYLNVRYYDTTSVSELSIVIE